MTNIIFKTTPNVKIFLNLLQGLSGVSFPAGGTTGQVLAKKTNANNDVEWITPTGGTGGTGWSSGTNGNAGTTIQITI